MFGNGKFSIGDITNGKNVIIFGADMSSSIYANNKLNNIYILGKNETQGINGRALYAKKICKQNFTGPDKNLY